MQRWTYSFVVWPSEQAQWSKAAVGLFEQLKSRLEFHGTADEFGDFRLALGRDGLTLREVERIPHHDPEGMP